MPQRLICLITALEELLLILKIMKELAAPHIHLPIRHITMVHPQVLGVGQRLLDRMEPFLKAVFRSGQADADAAFPPCRILFNGAPLLELYDQHQRFSGRSPFSQQHSVDPAANGSLIFQDQRQLVQSGTMDHIHQNGDGITPRAVLTLRRILLPHL